MTSRKRNKYGNKDFAKYYDGVTIFWLILLLYYIIIIFSDNELGVLIFSLIMGFVGYQIGLRKNKNPVRWFCFGFLFNIFIFLIMLIDNWNGKEKKYRKNTKLLDNPKEALRKTQTSQR